MDGSRELGSESGPSGADTPSWSFFSGGNRDAFLAIGSDLAGEFALPSPDTLVDGRRLRDIGGPVGGMHGIGSETALDIGLILPVGVPRAAVQFPQAGGAGCKFAKSGQETH